MKEEKNREEIVEHKGARGRKRFGRRKKKKSREKKNVGLWRVTTIITQTSRIFYDSRCCIIPTGLFVSSDKYPNLFHARLLRIFCLLVNSYRDILSCDEKCFLFLAMILMESSTLKLSMIIKKIKMKKTDNNDE